MTALLGHWAANALFDEEQYTGAGADLLARLDHPFFVQATVGLLIVALLSFGRHRAQRVVVLSRFPLAALLIGLQLLLFLGLESSERIAVDLFAGGTTEVGVFGIGFVAELIVAVGSALVLTVVAEAAKRCFRIGRAPHRHVPRERRFCTSVGFPPAAGVLSGAGGVRAPPSRQPARSS